MKDVKQKMKDLNVQLDNLCQVQLFLILSDAACNSVQEPSEHAV